MPDWAWWLIISVVFAFGELIVFTGFILGPLAIAAAVTAIAAGLGAPIGVQLAVFAVLAIGSMFALRPIAKRHMSSPPEFRTNAAALVDKQARVLEALSSDAPGLIRLENENWTARPVPGIDRIAPETYVRVVEIAGATAIVEPIDSTS
jgi:membrane protein implicated in regulation of membrane protease activity